MAESVDLATLHITVTTKEVKEGTEALGGLAGAAGRAENATNSFSSAASGMSSRIAGMVAQILALVSAYKALEAATSFVKRGIGFSSEMEDSRIAIASVISAVNKISDSQGRVLGLPHARGGVSLCGVRLGSRSEVFPTPVGVFLPVWRCQPT